MTLSIDPVLFIYKFLFFIFEREREREGANGGGAGREEDSRSEVGSVLTAENLMWGLNS